MNPCDLSEILDRLGYYIDDNTGEVMLEIDPCGPPIIDNLLVILASQGKLITKRNPEYRDRFLPTQLDLLQQHGGVLQSIPLRTTV